MPVTSKLFQQIGALDPKSHAHVRAIHGDKFVVRRLAMLGIRPGIKLELVHGPGLHGVVVLIGGARVALGHGIIEHILVEPIALSNNALNPETAS